MALMGNDPCSSMKDVCTGSKASLQGGRSCASSTSSRSTACAPWQRRENDDQHPESLGSKRFLGLDALRGTRRWRPQAGSASSSAGCTMTPAPIRAGIGQVGLSRPEGEAHSQDGQESVRRCTARAVLREERDNKNVLVLREDHAVTVLLCHSSILAHLPETRLAVFVRVGLVDVVQKLDLTNKRTAHPVRSGIAEPRSTVNAFQLLHSSGVVKLLAVLLRC
eukprot:6214027-Pleurochrysis_carterae.AAC.2